MAYQIRISPQALYLAADEYRKLADYLSNLNQDLNGLVMIIDNAWEGMAGAYAMESLMLFCNMSQKLIEGYEQYSNMLKDIVSCFQDAEQKRSIRSNDLVQRVYMKDNCQLPDVHISLKENIRVIPEDIRMVAGHCEEIASEYKHISYRTIGILDNLHEVWQGNLFQRFQEYLHEYAQELLESGEFLEDYARRVRHAADLYEEADRLLAY